MHFARRFLTCALLLSMGSAVTAQSLDDAAQRERERRAKLKSDKPTKTYSEDELKQAKGDTYNQVQGPAPSASRPGSGSTSGSSSGSVPSIRPTSAPSGEVGWHARAAQARLAQTQAEARVKTLETKAAGLPAGPFGPSTPCTVGAAAGSVNGRVTTSVIQLRDEARNNPQKICDDTSEREKEARAVQGELEQAKATLDQAKKAVNDLDDLARRAGVPAGWVR